MSAIAKNTASQIRLPKDDAAALAQCESRIDSVTRAAYLDVGLMLKAIRDRKLYKVQRADAVAGRYSFTTFEEYVEERWDMAYSRSAQLIDAAEACDKISTIVEVLPARESHVRELLKIEDDGDRAMVWEAVAGSGQAITARLIADEVNRFLSPAEADERLLLPPGSHEAHQYCDDEHEETCDTSNEEDEAIVVDCEEDQAAGHLVDDAEQESLASEETRQMFSVEEYNALSDEEWEQLLDAESDAKLNKQDSTSIEWAQWSWNPITGCKHDCPYCYARDIAKRYTNVYKNGFEPSIWPARLQAPFNTYPPKAAEDDVSYKNVFTGSMADIFGRWVPAEWIEAVLWQVAENPQWNFLFLTKFPQRVHEFDDLPENAWMGTTVDCQERVANAEKAFAKMKGGVKWLSVEPMLTPLKFSRLELFDWVVIGGASRSSQTPAWVPPFDWVADLHEQAREAGCAIYHKDNLGLGDGIRLKEFPWQQRDKKTLPDALKYLSIK